MHRGDLAVAKRTLRHGVFALSALVAALALALPAAASAARGAHAAKRVAHAARSGIGELDCNGQSPVQQSMKMTFACTDIRGTRPRTSTHGAAASTTTGSTSATTSRT